jgi:hypothetical protein
MKIRIIRIIIILVLVILAYIAGYYTRPDPGKPDIITTGDTDIIHHTGLDINNAGISFGTIATGAGSINTLISLDKIPEVQSWRTANNIITIDYSVKQVLGVNYYRRYDHFLVGAGAMVGPGIDLKISAGYMF